MVTHQIAPPIDGLPADGGITFPPGQAVPGSHPTTQELHSLPLVVAKEVYTIELNVVPSTSQIGDMEALVSFRSWTKGGRCWAAYQCKLERSQRRWLSVLSSTHLKTASRWCWFRLGVGLTDRPTSQRGT